MKGAPMMDTSKKHGTNSNFKKSGVTRADGSKGAPSMLGNILTGGMMGIGKKLFGKGKDGRPCPPPAAAIPGTPPPAPAGGQSGVSAGATTPPATPVPAEDPNAAAGATMHKDLKSGAPKSGVYTGSEAQPRKKKGTPKLKGKQHKIDKNKDGKISKADFDMMNKPGAPKVSDTLRKADEKVKDIGDKYNKSQIGKIMAKADRFMSNLDPIRNIREALTTKKKK